MFRFDFIKLQRQVVIFILLFITQDWAQAQLTNNMSPQWPLNASCREWLQQHYCVYHPKAPSTSSPTRTCLANEEYVKPVENLLMNVYDHLPPVHQKLICSIPMFYVSLTENGGTASLIKSSNTNKFQIFVSVGFGPKGFKDYSSQVNSMGHYFMSIFTTGFANPKPVNSLSEKPLDYTQNEIINSPDLKFNQDYYFNVVHELGHILDRVNGVNEPLSGCDQPSHPAYLRENCKFDTTNPKWWSSLSWINQKKSIYDSAETAGEKAFPERTRFWRLFGSRMGPLIQDNELEPLIYNLYTKTTFPTPLAAVQPYDDWAEGTVLWVLFDHLGWKAPLNLVTPANAAYNLTELYYSNPYSAKRDYLRNFFARTDLNYPAPFIAEDAYQDDILTNSFDGLWDEVDATCLSGAPYKPYIPKHLTQVQPSQEMADISKTPTFTSIDGAIETTYNLVVDERQAQIALVELQNEMLALALQPESMERNNMQIKLLQDQNKIFRDLRNFKSPSTCIERRLIFTGEASSDSLATTTTFLTERNEMCTWLLNYDYSTPNLSFVRDDKKNEMTLADDLDHLTIVGAPETNDKGSCPQGDQLRKQFKRRFKTVVKH